MTEALRKMQKEGSQHRRERRGRGFVGNGGVDKICATARSEFALTKWSDSYALPDQGCCPGSVWCPIWLSKHELGFPNELIRRGHCNALVSLACSNDCRRCCTKKTRTSGRTYSVLSAPMCRIQELESGNRPLLPEPIPPTPYRS